MHRRPAKSRGLMRLGATAPGSASRQDGDFADVAAAESAGHRGRVKALDGKIGMGSR